MSGREKKERGFEALASRYAEEYGRELLRELEQLNNAGAPQPSPGLEQRVRRGIRAKKRRAILRYSGVAAAACVLLLVVAAGIWKPLFTGSPAPALPFPAEEAAATPAPAPPAAITSAPQATTRPGVTPDAAIDPGASGGGPVYEAIPLGFALGEAFSLTGFEQDISRSIYYLENTWEDDVVLTLEYRKYAGAQDYSALEEFLVNGEYVYGAYRSEYSLLTFEKDGIVYTMTCKYDIHTLIELSEAILV